MAPRSYRYQLLFGPRSRLRHLLPVVVAVLLTVLVVASFLFVPLADGADSPIAGQLTGAAALVCEHCPG